MHNGAIKGDDMKNFNYSKYLHRSWDNEILQYVSQIHELKGRLSALEPSCKFKTKKLVEVAKIESIIFSNKIEGIVTTSARYKNIMSESAEPKNRDEQEILGYKNVLGIIHESHDYIPLKSSYILQLHAELYKYSEKSIGGKFKNVQNYIAETRADGTSFVRFEPLEPFLTPDAVTRLCEEFNVASSKYDVDPLILIPIFVSDLLCIHPFNDGNGRMSRLLTLLLLYKFGYDVGRFVSIEKIIEETKSGYYDALQKSSIGWKEDNNNPEYFIKYMLMVILRAYRDFDAKVQATKKQKSSAINIVQNAIMTRVGKFTKSDVIVLCPALSETTIERCLKQLIDSGKIEKHGERKFAFYTRKD